MSQLNYSYYFQCDKISYTQYYFFLILMIWNKIFKYYHIDIRDVDQDWIIVKSPQLIEVDINLKSQFFFISKDNENLWDSFDGTGSNEVGHMTNLPANLRDSLWPTVKLMSQGCSACHVKLFCKWSFLSLLRT